MRPPKRTRPPPSRAVRPSSRAPPASNVTVPLMASSECGSAKCRMRPPAIDGAAREHGLVAAARATSAARSAWPELRISRKKPCRMPRLASPVACSAIWLVGEVHGAADVEPRVLAHQPHLPTGGRSAGRGEADRAVVPQRVVEQVQRRASRRCASTSRCSAWLNSPAMRTRAARDGRRERRRAGLEGAHVRIERRVGERGSVSSASASGVSAMRPVARDDEPRRRGVELDGHDVLLRTPSRAVTSPMPSSCR